MLPETEAQSDGSSSGVSAAVLGAIAAGALIIIVATIAALVYIRKLKAARDNALSKAQQQSAQSVASVNSMGSMASMSSIFSVGSVASSVMDAPSRGKQAVMFNKGGQRQQRNCN